MKNNVVGWFEIPVLDMDRAIAFCERVFGFKMNRMPLGPLDMAIFPMVEGGLGTSGSLVCYPASYQPQNNGSLLYFTAHSGDLAIELARVNEAGGQVLQEKKAISPENGFMGLFLDTEGNRIAIHSRA